MSLESIAIMDQLDNPENTAVIARLSNGQFAPGNSAAAGNDAGKGWQKPSRRLAVMMNTMTVREIKDKLEGIGYENLNSLEAAILKRVNQAVDGEDHAIDFAFDRLEGKPTQKQELTGKDGGPLAVATADVGALLLELSQKATED